MIRSINNTNMTAKKSNLAFKLIFVLLILVVIFVVGAWLYYKSSLTAVDAQNTRVKAFVIPKGESTQKVIERLEEEGLIKSATVFKIFLRLNHPDINIQAGDFKLSPSMDAGSLVQKLQSGSEDVWVTL